MGISGEKDPSGLYVIRISGVFTNDQRKAMESAGRAEIDRRSKIKILILADGFAGWGKEGDWGISVSCSSTTPTWRRSPS